MTAPALNTARPLTIAYPPRTAFIGECVEPIQTWNPARDSEEETLLYIDISSVSQSEKKIIGINEIPASEAPSRARQLVRTGDVLVSTVRPNLNAVAFVPDEMDGATASTGFCVLRPDRTQLSGRYLFHWVQSPSFVTDMVKQATGQSYPAVSDTIVKQSKIPLPPLDEQKRIATILDQADELRRLRQRAIDRLNDVGQAIFYEMFGDPTTNPNGWDIVRLGDLCDVGSSKRVFVTEFVDEGVPFYRGTEVGQLGEGHPIEPDLFIAPAHYDDLIRHSGKPEMGDLLLPSICHDGRIWKVDDPEPFYFKDGRVLWIKSHKSNIDSEYLRRFLQNKLICQYEAIASGTTFAELKIVNLKNLAVLYPPIELQAEFSCRIAAVEAIRPVLRRSEVAVDSLFRSLQHNAFRGEL